MSIFSTGQSLQLMMRLLDPGQTTESLIETSPQKPSIPLGRSSQPLEEDTPENQGISSSFLAAFLQELADEPTLNMHSVLILRHGKLLCRAAFGAQRTDLPKQTYSACKSITSLAVGLAMDDGLLHPDDKLVELFAEECGSVNRQLLRGLTLSHLLTMTAPIPFNEAASMTTEDWVNGYLGSPRLSEPGKKFYYNSLNTYMLAAAVTKVTGRSLTDYLDERIFRHMGIADYYWETCPKGIVKGGWGLYMLPEDLAKLGILVQNGGVWNGRQLISRQYLDSAVHTWAVAPESYGDFNYGWQIWVGRKANTFLFNGMLGQNVLCFRDNDVILVSHAGNDESFQQSKYFSIAQKYFLPALSSEPLPKDPSSERLLKKYLRSVSAPKGIVPTQAAFDRFDGLRMAADHPYAVSAGLLPLVLQVVENTYSHGLQAITVGGSRFYPELFYEERDQVHHIIAGTEEPYLQELTIHGNVFRVAAQAVFSHDEDDNPMLRVRLDFAETPCTRIIKIFLTPSGPVVRQQETPGSDFLMQLQSGMPQSAAAKTVISAILGTSDPELIRWKVNRLFDQRMSFRFE